MPAPPSREQKTTNEKTMAASRSSNAGGTMSGVRSSGSGVKPGGGGGGGGDSTKVRSNDFGGIKTTTIRTQDQGSTNKYGPNATQLRQQEQLKYRSPPSSLQAQPQLGSQAPVMRHLEMGKPLIKPRMDEGASLLDRIFRPSVPDIIAPGSPDAQYLQNQFRAFKNPNIFTDAPKPPASSFDLRGSQDLMRAIFGEKPPAFDALGNNAAVMDSRKDPTGADIYDNSMSLLAGKPPKQFTDRAAIPTPTPNPFKTLSTGQTFNANLSPVDEVSQPTGPNTNQIINNLRHPTSALRQSNISNVPVNPGAQPTDQSDILDRILGGKPEPAGGAQTQPIDITPEAQLQRSMDLANPNAKPTTDLFKRKPGGIPGLLNSMFSGAGNLAAKTPLGAFIKSIMDKGGTGGGGMLNMGGDRGGQDRNKGNADLEQILMENPEFLQWLLEQMGQGQETQVPA